MPKGVRNTATKKTEEKIETSNVDNLEEEVVEQKDLEKEQLQNQIEMLKKQMEDMQKGFASMFGNNTAQSNNEEKEVEFVSLNDGLLNLSTDGRGNGVVYRFEEFGESQFVPLSDAKLLIKNNKSFIKDGRCYVNDEGLIKANNLTSVYKVIIDKKGFETLFASNKETFSSIFSKASEVQKEIFANIMIEKLSKGDQIDMNIVAEVEKLTGIDVLVRANSNKKIFSNEE